MAQQDRARATRANIIEGAAKVFDVVGYGLSNLADIANASSVTKGALYFHFKSKESLAEAVIAEQHTRVQATSESVLAERHSALPSMVLVSRRFAEQLQVDPVVRAGIRLTFEASTFGASVRDPYEDWIAMMKHLSVMGQNDGTITTVMNPSSLAQFLVASFTGVQMVSDILTKRQDLSERLDDMWSLLLPVLSPEHIASPAVGE